MGHRRRLFLISLVALLLITATHAGGHAQAAAAITQKGMDDDDGVGSIARSMVGSRPPSCAGKCWWCGDRRCQAVQVPISPQDQKSRRHGRGAGGASSSVAHELQQHRPSSYDDHSNYKPLSWRCKCGG